MSEERAVYVAGLDPGYWQAAEDALCRLRREVEVLDHRLITVRVLPAIECACAEAQAYREACLKEASSG